MYDKSASQIIDEYLLVEAKACLNNPIHSIQNVAELLSFSDQAAFYKFFKRCSGISPSQFKKEKKTRKFKQQKKRLIRHITSIFMKIPSKTI